MKITINSDVLKKYGLNIKEFLVLLIGYFELGYDQEYEALMERGLVERNLFHHLPPILSDNTKNMVAKILMESDDKAVKSGIDFKDIAEKLIACYPKGIKPGTTYPWVDDADAIAQKLRTLVVKYDFTFTEEEAIAATKEYVGQFKDYKHMKLLKYFILKTTDDGQGRKEIDSPFMSIIENNRSND